MAASSARSVTGPVLQSRLGDSPTAQRLQDELLASVGRVNYNQDRLNALAGKDPVAGLACQGAWWLAGCRSLGI